MRSRSLLVLALVTLAVGAFIWFVERDLPTTQELEARKDRLFDLEADAIDRVRLVHDGQPVVLERPPRSAEDPDVEAWGAERAAWHLVEPLAARADGADLEQFLGQVLGVETLRVLESGAPADYGLEPPSLRVTLESGGVSHSLDVGNELPASSRRVVRLGDADTLYVVEAPFFDQAVRAGGEWRDKKLFHAGRSEVQSLRLSGPAGEILLARRGDRYWLESPIRDLAGRDEVDALISTLTSLAAERFVDAPTASEEEMGLAPAVGTLEVVLANQEEPFRLAWGAPVGLGLSESAEAGSPETTSEAGHFARVGEVLVETRADLGAVFERSLADWRSYRWMSLSSYEVDRLRLIDGDEELVLSRDGVDWTRGSEKIGYSSVSGLLTQLGTLRADELVDAADVPASPRWTLELTDKQGALTTLALYPSEPSGRALATASHRSVGLRFGPETIESLESALEAVRTAEVIDEGSDEVAEEPAAVTE